MNKLSGVIKNITIDGAFQLVELRAQELRLCAINTEVDPGKSYLKEGDGVIIFFKETAMSISKNLSGEISIQNHFPCLVKSIETGQVLSKVQLAFKQQPLFSVITTASVKRMRLTPGDPVLGLVKTTDLHFSKIES